MTSLYDNFAWTEQGIVLWEVPLLRSFLQSNGEIIIMSVISLQLLVKHNVKHHNIWAQLFKTEDVVS